MVLLAVASGNFAVFSFTVTRPSPAKVACVPAIVAVGEVRLGIVKSTSSVNGLKCKTWLMDWNDVHVGAFPPPV